MAALEARFRKMLTAQIGVYNGTVVVSKTPIEKWIDTMHARSRELSQMENEIAMDAAKALQVLREEGTSVAFPIAVEDLHDDILQVARRLEESKAFELTQAIEQDIIEALNEMVEALQKEMDKSKNDQQQQAQQQNGQKQEPGLVDLIGELKMLRTLQQRINRRTKQYGRLLEGEQATEPDLLEQLRSLSRRQARVQQSAYDLATKKNQ